MWEGEVFCPVTGGPDEFKPPSVPGIRLSDVTGRAVGDIATPNINVYHGTSNDEASWIAADAGSDVAVLWYEEVADVEA